MAIAASSSGRFASWMAARSASSASASGSGSSSGSMIGSTYDDYYHAVAGKGQNEHADIDNTNVDDAFCMFGAPDVDKAGCKKPRSCSACLRVAGCMVNSTGCCVSAALHYNESLDFRVAQLFVNDTLSIRSSYDYWNTSGAASNFSDQRWIFPSTSVSYCEPGDPICAQCNQSIFPHTVVPDMRFCVGANACVCTALCESPLLDAARDLAAVCDPSTAPSKPLPQPVMWIIGSAAALLVCSFLYWWMWRRTSDTYERAETVSGEAARCYGGKDPSQDKSVGPQCAVGSSLPSIHHVTHLDTPVFDMPILELSTTEYPRLSGDAARRSPEQWDGGDS